MGENSPIVEVEEGLQTVVKMLGHFDNHIYSKLK